jgi:hypothetical protein
MSASHDTSAEVGVTPAPHVAPGLLGRMKGMLLRPRAEWERIAREPTSTARIYTHFVMPLAATAALVGVAQVSIVGTVNPLAGTVRAPLGSALMTGVLAFACGLVGIFLVAWIIDALVPFFGAVHHRGRATAIAAYASAPVWVAALFSPFPTIWPVLQVVAVCYHTYLLYLGLRVLMRAATDRVLGYATTVVLCTILLEIVFTLASTALAGANHMNPYRAFG